MDGSLADIKAAILRLRFQAHRLSAQNSDAKEGDVLVENIIDDYLATSEAVLSSASDYFGSSKTGTTQEPVSIFEFGSEKVRNVEDWIAHYQVGSNRDSVLDDRTNHERAIVSAIGAIAEEKFVQGNYADARRFFVKFLERTEVYEDWDVREVYSTQLKLAVSYCAEGDHNAAEQLLQSMNLHYCSLQERSQNQQCLAELAFLRSDMNSAKISAGNAMNIRKNAHDQSSFYDSASLLVLISTKMGESEEAEVYQRYIPTGYKPRRIPGWFEALRKSCKNCLVSNFIPNNL